MPLKGHSWWHGLWLPLLLPLFCCGTQEGEAPASRRPALLWRIAGDPPSYLFGTVHLPDARVLDLPVAVREAIAASQAVFTELEMDPDSQARNMNLIRLPDGQTLRDALPPDLLGDLESYLASKDIPLQAVERLNVMAVQMQLALVDHLAELRVHQPLDAELYLAAQAAGKEVGGIETAAEQAAAFSVLDPGEQFEYLRRTLRRLREADQKGESLTERLLLAYLTGRPEAIEAFVEEELDPADPLDRKLREAMLTRRNQVMAERTGRWIKENSGRSGFFAFGAAHLPGDDGVVQRLCNMGFEVRLLDENGAPVGAAEGVGAGS